MYNSDMPTRAELPSSRQLLRSTAIAVVAAAGLLVTVVLPAEYAVDPIGVGRFLGLTTMGEVKGQLAREAEDDRRRDAQAPGRGSSVLPGLLKGLLIGEARAEPAAAQEASVTLAPGEGSEIKMAMKAGAKADYRWTASGSVNYDMHGTAPGGRESSYKRGREATGDVGILTAGYDGHHGWFWRNRGQEPVTVTVKVSGNFTDLKRMK
ncbi:hypothetical protein [Methylorubrum extorquens]|jgi:hypothetical protein|uniref:Transmembrane anchor protein n=1 Tax=Methylorubrum extorquens (strain ATCC 14718 / DSM 1338 / JCM 2805 / NCIMB 9133 / AM1) TaxID=272630 RepID=C5B6Q2_METEA|nr:hypothetical protein [Methylorubrum extorquens]ACS44134.1 conserved hypothetical protein [Methylorubrum extorquens AM1]MCP1546736.1 hypothetical protein [Methylorubrum extorquens]MCP1591940.1 hypothetical protein [Methylorubrum extorquens]